MCTCGGSLSLATASAFEQRQSKCVIPLFRPLAAAIQLLQQKFQSMAASRVLHHRRLLADADDAYSCLHPASELIRPAKACRRVCRRCGYRSCWGALRTPQTPPAALLQLGKQRCWRPCG